jgi:hypothetical protein
VSGVSNVPLDGLSVSSANLKPAVNRRPGYRRGARRATNNGLETEDEDGVGEHAEEYEEHEEECLDALRNDEVYDKDRCRREKKHRKKQRWAVRRAALSEFAFQRALDGMGSFNVSLLKNSRVATRERSPVARRRAHVTSQAARPLCESLADEYVRPKWRSR